MKQKIIEVTDEMKPQQSLETILQLEIEIAEKIAEEKDKADQKVTKTQNSTADHKNQIIENARLERDRMIEEGIAVAKQTAEERVTTAKKDAEDFVKVGKNYEKEAAEHVLRFIFGTDSQEEK